MRPKLVLRSNCYYASEITPSNHPPPGDAYNRNEYRPLEGFLCGMPPVPTARKPGVGSCPHGNTVVWKPARHVFRLSSDAAVAAGHPTGSSTSSRAGQTSRRCCHGSPDLARVHFTGSTETFQTLGRPRCNIRNYKSSATRRRAGGKDSSSLTLRRRSSLRRLSAGLRIFRLKCFGGVSGIPAACGPTQVSRWNDPR